MIDIFRIILMYRCPNITFELLNLISDDKNALTLRTSAFHFSESNNIDLHVQELQTGSK
jgi:hypothetical protein